MEGEHRDLKTGAQHYLTKVHTCSLGKSILFLPGEKWVTPGWSKLCCPGREIPGLDFPSGRGLVSPSLGCKEKNCQHQTCYGFMSRVEAVVPLGREVPLDVCS